MKTIILLVLMSTLSAHSIAETLRLSEPVAKDPQGETFGTLLDSHLPKIALSALATSPDEYLGRLFQLEAPISKVCQKKGCFFIVQTEERAFRVSFRDYGFFIPTDSGGKQVVLNGELVQQDISPSQAEHFTSDLRSDADVIRAGIVYEIIADSIRIPTQ